MRDKLRYENAVYGKLARFPRPTIAAIEGVAMGGGLELAVCCDLIVVAEGALIGLPEIRIGGFPGSGGGARDTRRIGVGRTKGDDAPGRYDRRENSPRLGPGQPYHSPMATL